MEPDDVAHARRCLDEAADRAIAARLRLQRLQLQLRERSPARQFVGQPATFVQEVCAVEEVRGRARELPFSSVFGAYLRIGGDCTEFELEAFIYAGTGLPEHELTVLDHAVWELTEFGS